MSNQNFDKKAAIVSISAHMLLLLICLFIGYTLPANTNKPLNEMGMEVNLGSSDEGSGDDQPFSTNQPAFQPNTENQENQENQSNQQDLLQDDGDNDAPEINSKIADKPKKITNNEIKKQQNPQPKPKILFPNNNGNGGNAAQTDMAGTNEGNGTGNGDKGVAGGTAGASNYTGTPGSGGGIGHSFNNRSIVAKPNLYDDFKEGGKVVIRITINREGFIVAKIVKSASNAEVRKMALEKIEKVRFSKSETAPPEQFGDITFVFKTRANK